MGIVQENKANILLIGGGAVGAIAALNIEAGGLGSVTAVLRSNFSIVKEEGYIIESVDHGKISGWRPTKGKDPLVTEETILSLPISSHATNT